MSLTEEERLSRLVPSLLSSPTLTLPTDYPRPPRGHERSIEALQSFTFSPRLLSSLIRLSYHQEEDEEDASPPTVFQLVLAGLLVLLARYTAESEIVVATSSPIARDPLLVKVGLEPGDGFWNLVRRVVWQEKEAEELNVPFEMIEEAVKKARGEEGDTEPLFRVRFLDEMDRGPSMPFLSSTSLTTDLVFSLSSSSPPSTPPSQMSTHALPSLPPTTLTITYNSLLFSPRRIQHIFSQLECLLTKTSHNPDLEIFKIPIHEPGQTQAGEVIPNPRANLHWTSWPGPITHIFARHAETSPERLCVVEERDDEQRRFSYAQIHRAALRVAKVLLKNGLKREEVVTIFSTRGVELLVAVVGTLMAGGTFSVIDPAYPPTRQQIYLSVARPRALITLSRAGTLPPSVRQYVAEQLSLRIEIPSLELLSSGSLSIPPNLDADDLEIPASGVGLGPDSIGTLSFTSGSTGIPKGVRGRHYSLTHFFSWMSERFVMGENERFTMLSGIAHDPIQRDMFTPLFLGASLWIPTAEDIGTPGRLAQWMADKEVTVTHLTPAMGQLLSAQAKTQIPSLRNAFFVGDILTKRDCTRLQQLASNCQIINMFGTTETQRAVSYFPIPPLSVDPTFLKTRKDIVPAGSGMVDVQLLVVNRQDKTQLCAVGEIGEIYVRSGGLAEGYLDLEEDNRVKFVENWFASSNLGKRKRKGSPEQDVVEWEDTLHGAEHWKGVRDRMYRSGDLGRYLPNGVVECTGRADDQIKIRGFRIELGEIDTHLSRHPLVRENVTLVRRDKYEEKVLVSYFVPLGGEETDKMVSESEGEVERKQGKEEEAMRGLRRYRKLIKDMREYLKTKLPSYSIPSVFVPLSRMPLNPNGKIDKPALPFPDTIPDIVPSTSKTGKDVKRTATEAALESIWTRILTNIPSPVPLDESFFDLGGHSILATRMIFEIRKAFSPDAPLGLIFEYPTLRSMARQIDELRNQDMGFVEEESKDAVAKISTDISSRQYAEDEVQLLKKLRPSYDPPLYHSDGKRVIFLTGATGFLGSFILKDLLQRDNVAKVICLVRAKDDATARSRLKENSEGRGVWNESWVEQGRLEVVAGNLETDRFGLDKRSYEQLSKDVDAIVHNGALVHWVYPYSKLRSANVLSTLAIIDFASAGRPKALSFVSSTASIENSHYLHLSDSVL
ncbi:large subunit of L-aminoadipate-semialdehyde dehydrogenase, partial [Atractiella rhizophila]